MPTHDHSHDRADAGRLAGIGAAVLGLHVLGWGLYLTASAGHPALAGLGVLAYVLGLRHGFDADHIVAIDNTTRTLLQRGRSGVGAGLAFSLGHSTVVLGLTVALAAAAGAVAPALPVVRAAGGVVGATVSGTFLVLVGLANLVLLVGIARAARDLRRGADAAELERRLQASGPLSRLLRGRLGRGIDASWKMYPLGILFGLGFDTASEVALLATAAGVATSAAPALAVVSLPLIFAAGMSLVDAADGVLMSRAYGWSLSSPVRRVYCNMALTGASVATALFIGGNELLQVAAGTGG